MLDTVFAKSFVYVHTVSTFVNGRRGPGTSEDYCDEQIKNRRSAMRRYAEYSILTTIIMAGMQDYNPAKQIRTLCDETGAFG